MTQIRTNCPRCGEVELAATSLELHLAAEENTYTFVCPACEELVRKPADSKIVKLLSSVGVRVSTPITEAEVIHFTEVLRRRDDIAELAKDEGAA